MLTSEALILAIIESVIGAEAGSSSMERRRRVAVGVERSRERRLHRERGVARAGELVGGQPGRGELTWLREGQGAGAGAGAGASCNWKGCVDFMREAVVYHRKTGVDRN